MPKRSDFLILHDLRSIESQLSPENLTQDGERSPERVRVVRDQLIAKQRQLHAELGRIPTTAELYGLDVTCTPGGKKLLKNLFGGRCRGT